MNGLFRPRVPEFQIYPSTFPFLIFLTSTFKILATLCDISGERCKKYRENQKPGSPLRSWTEKSAVSLAARAAALILLRDLSSESGNSRVI